MVTIEVQGDALSKKLLKFAVGLSPQKREKINRKLAIDLSGIVLRNFAEERGEGRRWRRLKPATLRRKRKLGYEKILQNTGALRASFVPDSDANFARVAGKSYVPIPNKKTGKTPTRVRTDLALIHQFGDPKRNIPARPMLPSANEARRAAIRVYDVEIERAQNEAKL